MFSHNNIHCARRNLRKRGCLITFCKTNPRNESHKETIGKLNVWLRKYNSVLNTIARINHKRKIVLGSNKTKQRISLIQREDSQWRTADETSENSNWLMLNRIATKLTDCLLSHRLALECWIFL